MKVQSYKELTVWQKGIEIVDVTYASTKSFPRDERFVLTQQMNKAAISIPSNIAEGFSRSHTLEYKQFLRVALASCSELETQFIVAFNQGLIDQTRMNSTSALIDQECRMLMNLIKSLGNRSQRSRSTIHDSRSTKERSLQ